MKNNTSFPIRLLVLVLIIFMIGIGGVFLYENHQASLSARQAMLHQKGTTVMPFNLNQTTHIFKKTDTGGIQQVVVKDANNNQQIPLVRMHLQMEAQLFQKGDFTDPKKLHGGNMPGMQTLSNGASQIKIAYSDLPNGGQITYNTNNANLVTSIHAWFDAQLSDHGNDALGM